MFQKPSLQMGTVSQSSHLENYSFQYCSHCKQCVGTPCGCCPEPAHISLRGPGLLLLCHIQFGTPNRVILLDQFLSPVLILNALLQYRHLPSLKNGLQALKANTSKGSRSDTKHFGSSEAVTQHIMLQFWCVFLNLSRLVSSLTTQLRFERDCRLWTGTHFQGFLQDPVQRMLSVSHFCNLGPWLFNFWHHRVL